MFAARRFIKENERELERKFLKARFASRVQYHLSNK